MPKLSCVGISERKEMLADCLARLSIEFQTRQALDAINTFVVGDDITAAVSRRKTAHILKVTIPHLSAVVSVDCEHIVLSLDIQDTVGKDRHRRPPVSRHDSRLYRATPPEHTKRQTGKRISGRACS